MLPNVEQSLASATVDRALLQPVVALPDLATEDGPFAEAQRRRLEYRSLDKLLITLIRPDKSASIVTDELLDRDAGQGAQESSDRAQLIHLIRGYTACPPGSPGRFEGSRELLNSLWAHWEASGDWVVLGACIEVATEIVVLHRADEAVRAKYLVYLGEALLKRFDHTNQYTLLDEAIFHLREALELRLVGHPNRTDACHWLAASLRARYTEGDGALLDEAAFFEGQALILQREGHPDWGQSLVKLVDLYQRQFLQTSSNTLLVEMVQIARLALSLHPVGHEHRAQSCRDLAMSLGLHSEHTGDSASIDEAIQLHQELSSLRAWGHPSWKKSRTELAAFLVVKYRHTGDITALDHAITISRQILAIHPTGDASRAMACDSLALYLRMRCEQTDDYTLLDEAIQLDREATALLPVDHSQRSQLCIHLATSLDMKYDQTSDGALLEEAVQLAREAVKLLAVDDFYLSHCRLVLAGLLAQCGHLGDVALLDEAIQLQRTVLAGAAGDHPVRPYVCEALAKSLSTLGDVVKDATLIEESVQLHREAVSLLPAEHPRWRLACYRLANAIYMSDQHIGNPALVDEMSCLLDKSLPLFTPEHSSRWMPFWLQGQLALLRSDHSALVTALGLILNSFTRNVHQMLTALLNLLDRVDLNVLSHDDRLTLLKLYASTLDLVTVAVGFTLDRPSQLKHIPAIGSRAFVLSSMVDDLPVGLQLLERARGVIWSLMLHIRDPQLDRVTVVLADRLHSVLGDMKPTSGQVQQLSAAHAFLSVRDVMHEQRSRFQQILREIRLQPGLEDFMRGLGNGELLATSAQNPVVVLIVDENKCHALILTSPKEPLTDLLLSIDASAVQELTQAKSASSQRGSVSDVDDDQRAIRIAKFRKGSQSTLAQLWRAIVKPVLTHLQLERKQGQERPRIYWCPTGPFAFAPVHAAGIYTGPDQECCADYVVSSYAPTLTALSRAQKHSRVYTTRAIQVTTIAVEQAQDASLPCLRHVIQEARQIVDIAENAGAAANFVAEDTSKDAIIASLESANVVHLACHGIQHSTEPHESHFCLGSGNLTVSDLIEVDLKDAFFAFLSACETAKGDRKHADEVVHLATTMLFAGFQSVVATMWAMHDQDGPFITKRFYERLLAGETVDVDTVAYALDYAVSELRASGVPPERWATFVHMGA